MMTCDDRDCQRKLDMVYTWAFGEDGAKHCLLKLKQMQLPKWAAMIVSGLLIIGIGASVVTYAEVKGLPDKYTTKDNYALHCQEIAVLKEAAKHCKEITEALVKQNKVIQDQVQDNANQQRIDTKLVLDAIKAIKP